MEVKKIIKETFERGNQKEIAEMFSILREYDFFGMAYKVSDFHKLVKEIRMFHGLTQLKFAEKIKIERSILSRYENGERVIPLEVIDNILAEFDLKIIVSPKDEHDEIIESIKKEENEKKLKRILEWTKKRKEKSKNGQ